MRVRIFSPLGEMPFAGHPVIGTTFALAHEGLISPGQPAAVLGLGLGPTNVDLKWKGSELAFAWMTQRPPQFGAVVAGRERVAAILGITASHILAAAPVQEISCGLPFVLMPLVSRRALQELLLCRCGWTAHDRRFSRGRAA